MKVWEIYYDSTVVGIVLDEKGTHSSDDALNAWNNANPNYAGTRAESTPFITI